MFRHLCALTAVALMVGPAHLRAEANEDAFVVEGLSRALEAQPDNTKARVKRGLYYLWRTFDYEKALHDFNQVLESEPDNVTAYIGRADVYTGWDSRFYDPRKAEKDAQKALELAPESSDVFRILGDLPGHPGMGKPEDSLVKYKRAVELDPKNLLAQIGLAYTYAKKGTPFHSEEKALRHASKALEIAPNESLALEAMGDLLSAEEETRRDGIRLLNRAVAINPRSMGSYLARGYTYLAWSMEEEWPVLIQALQEQNLGIVDSIRGNDEAFKRAMEKLGRRSRFARALSDFDEAAELCPHSDDVHSARAYALQNFPGQERRALESFTQAVKLNPRNANALIERAEYLITNPHLMVDPKELDGKGRGKRKIDAAELGEMIANRFPAASKELEGDLSKALEIRKNALAFFLRGSLRGSALRDYEGAIQDLSEAIELEPLDPDYYEARAAVHEAFGHDDRADRDRERISDLQNLD